MVQPLKEPTVPQLRVFPEIGLALDYACRNTRTLQFGHQLASVFVVCPRTDNRVNLG